MDKNNNDIIALNVIFVMLYNPRLQNISRFFSFAQITSRISTPTIDF